MKEFFKQLGSLFGAGFAAACCLGVPLVLSTLGAVGLGFVVHDAYLLPLFVGFVGLSLWLLYRSATRKARLAPFWPGLAGGVIGSAALWLLVTGTSPATWAVYVGLALLLGGSVWDLRNARSHPRVASETPAAGAVEESREQPSNPARRTATGAALSVAAAAVFYSLYKSVDAMKPQASSVDIACWGINSCKGTTACSTAFNACTGMNTCRGRGYVYVSEADCKSKGGKPLAGSQGDPARG